MLRFAEAWPATSTHAAVIVGSFGLPGSHCMVTLHAAHRPVDHTLRRWDSFGWTATIKE